jgi:hypothetical protein
VVIAAVILVGWLFSQVRIRRRRRAPTRAAAEAGGSAVTTPPARPEEPRNWYRDVEHRPGGLHVLARRPLVRVMRDARDSAELVRVVSDITRWTINLPSAAETPKGHGEPSCSDCLGTDGTPVCGPDQAEDQEPLLTPTQRRRNRRTPPAGSAAFQAKRRSRFSSKAEAQIDETVGNALASVRGLA